jgi:hypothetical protein
MSLARPATYRDPRASTACGPEGTARDPSIVTLAQDGSRGGGPIPVPHAQPALGAVENDLDVAVIDLQIVSAIYEGPQSQRMSVVALLSDMSGHDLRIPQSKCVSFTPCIIVFGVPVSASRFHISV